MALPPPKPAEAAPAPSPEPPSPLLPASSAPAALEAALGLQREGWRAVQRALTVLGFDAGGSDGRPGPATRKAVAAWQGNEGQEATGYLTGPQRDRILREARPKLARPRRAGRTDAAREERPVPSGGKSRT